MKDLGNVLIGIAFLTLVAFGVGSVVYGSLQDWADTGTVNWISGKQFNPSNNNFASDYWIRSYSIQTLSHGVLNFTVSKQAGPHWFCQPTGPSLQQLNMSLLVGIIKNNFGCLTLVVDP